MTLDFPYLKHKLEEFRKQEHFLHKHWILYWIEKFEFQGRTFLMPISRKTKNNLNIKQHYFKSRVTRPFPRLQLGKCYNNRHHT